MKWDIIAYLRIFFIVLFWNLLGKDVIWCEFYIILMGIGIIIGIILKGWDTMLYDINEIIGGI